MENEKGELKKYDKNYFNDIIKNIKMQPNPDVKCKLCNDLGDENYQKEGEFFKLCICEQTKAAKRKFQNFVQAARMGDLKHMTFKGFEPQTSIQEKAFNAIRYNHKGYYLFGDYGVGKTHLMAATAFKAMANNIPAVLYSVPFLLNEIRCNQGEIGSIEKSVIEIPYLILDDIGKPESTKWVNDRLYFIIDERYKRFKAGKCHTSFTSQYPLKQGHPNSLDNYIRGDVVSRIQGMVEAIYIDGDDWRLKV